MEVVYFIVVGVGLYALSDFALRRVEQALGHRLEHRELIFFGVLLVSALVAFALIRELAPG